MISQNATSPSPAPTVRPPSPLPAKPRSSPQLSSAYTETLAGLSAGAASTLAVHPLDVIKTRLQIYRAHHPLLTTTTNAPAVPATSSTILRSLLAQPTPIRSLYRGLAPNLIGNTTSWGLFFTFKSLLERPLSAHRSRHEARLSPADYFLTSTLSGMLVTLATNPIWVLKTRFLSTNATEAGSYTSLRDGISTMLRTEGWGSFYKGLGVSMMGVSHGGVQFAVYSPLQDFWMGYRRRIMTGGLTWDANAEARSPTTAGDKPSTQATLVISSLAKITAGVVTYPYQVLRSRLQTYDSEVRFGKGIKEVSKRMWQESGLREFYRGVGMNTVRVLPATWVTFLVYENVRWWAGRE